MLDQEGGTLIQKQTYIGHVLVSVNPFRDCGSSTVDTYGYSG